MNFMNPKHWGGLLCALLTMGLASAQSVQYPFNPDHNGDNLIYTADILEVLAVYETEFDPEPITVDGLTLEEYLIQLNDAIDAVEAGTAGADGADGVGVASVGLSASGELIIQLTDGTTVDLGCVLDSDGDSICDQEDACSDLEAANYNAASNGDCQYNQWMIPTGLTIGPAVLGTVIPLGYRVAHFECVQSIVDGDAYCVDVEWDNICQDAYDACLVTDEVLLADFEYQVGDEGPAGGIIVYVDTFDVHVGFDYLEAASSDFNGVGFFPGSVVEDFSLDCGLPVILQPTGDEEDAQPAMLGGGGGDLVPDGSYRVRNAGGTAIGTGLTNTLELARHGTCSHFVAKQVLQYSQNGYRDFFIPSIAELEVMAAALGDLGGGIVLMGGGGSGGTAPPSAEMSGDYWSSSEFDSTSGYGISVINILTTLVIPGTAGFDFYAKIRPVRAF